jgi:hypothetical protein
LEINHHMNSLNRWLEKSLKVRYVLLLSLVMFFLMVLIAGLIRHQYLKPFNSRIGRWIENIAGLPSNIKNSISHLSNATPSFQIILNRFTNHYKSTSILNNNVDSNYLIQSRFDKSRNVNIIELVSLKKNEVIKEWIPDLKKVNLTIKITNSFFNIDNLDQKTNRIFHPLLLADGSIIFNYFNGPTIKIDTTSNIVWIVNGVLHHSTESDAENNLWSPSIIEPNCIKDNLLKKIQDDAITQISPEGKILFQRSIVQILVENGYKGLLMGTGVFEEDPVHLNEIKPALYTTRYWQKGDLLISLRNKSTVFLYRPSINKIIWLQTGPWLNQHCPDFVDSSKISVFGNDVVRTPGSYDLIYDHNNIYIYDLATHTIDTSYNEMMRTADVRTLTEGRLKILPNKDVIIEESNYGRVLRANKKEVLWQRLNYVDSDSSHVNVGNWSRYLHRTGDCKFCLSEY